MSKIILITLMAFLFTRGYAQEEPPLVTDRPDQTESAVVIPAWRLQIETGLSKEWVSSGSDSYEENTRFGTTLLRFGLFDFKVYSSDKWQHSFVFSFAHSLSERWGLGYNLGYEFEGNFEVSA